LVNYSNDKVVPNSRTMSIEIKLGYVFVGIEKTYKKCVCQKMHLEGVEYSKDGQNIVSAKECSVSK